MKRVRSAGRRDLLLFSMSDPYPKFIPIISRFRTNRNEKGALWNAAWYRLSGPIDIERHPGSFSPLEPTTVYFTIEDTNATWILLLVLLVFVDSFDGLPFMVIPRVTRKGKGINRVTIVMLWVDAVTRSTGDARTIRAHARTISKQRSFLCAATRLFAANVRVIATPLVIRDVWCRLTNIKMTASSRMNKPWYSYNSSTRDCSFSPSFPSYLSTFSTKKETTMRLYVPF